MRKKSNFIASLLFLFGIPISFILIIILICTSCLAKKLNLAIFIATIISIISTIFFYFLAYAFLNPLERNEKKYIEKRFLFLLEKGYTMAYSFINGQSSSVFIKNDISFLLIIENQTVELIVRKGIHYPYEVEINIFSLLPKSMIDVRMSSIQFVDYLSNLLKENYEFVLQNINKEGV